MSNHLLTTGHVLLAYAWSSCWEYRKPLARRWPWLRVDRLLGEVRLPKKQRGVPAGV